MRPRLIRTIVLSGIFLSCLAGGLWMLRCQTEWAVLFKEPVKKNQAGGHDWVNWVDGPRGITANSVHPLAEKIQNERGDYVRKGDILRKLDYVPVPKADPLQRIIRVAPPGKVFIYQLERNPESQNPETINIFVRNSNYPAYVAATNAYVWNAGYWISALGAFACLLSFFIVFPLLRTLWKRDLPKLLAIFFSFVFFGLMLSRQVFLSASGDLSNLFQEFLFFPLISLVALVVAVNYLVSLLEKRQRLIGMLLGVFPLILVVMIMSDQASGLLWIRKGLETESVYLFTLLSLAGTLLISVSIKWSERSFADKIFTGGALFILLFQILYHARSFFFSEPGIMPSDESLLAFQVTMLVPAASLTAGELKFGKVNVVLTQSLLFLAIAVFALLLFSGIQQMFYVLGLNFRYQALAELSLLMVVLILLRSLYNLFEPRLRQFFTLSQQSRMEDMNRFISSISRYTGSEKLLKDVPGKIESWFGASFAQIDSPENEKSVLSEELMEELMDALDHPEDFWSRSKQLSPLTLEPAMETELMKTQVSLVFPIRTKENESLLVIGKKSRSVFNLTEIELFGRLIQQTRLSLEVLSLVERERLLVEKNYEANLTALRSQINPHFLFNTLNTISSLIHDAPNDAERAIEKLAFIFRYTLKNSGEQFVPLKDELSLVRSYLDIEHFRFGDRLNVEIDLDPDSLEIPIPAMVVQTVVENCIKHGISKILAKGVVSIKTEMSDTGVKCIVYDNGPGIDLSKIRSSTGLNNILTRMKEIYKRENLLYFENTGEGTRVTINIPQKHG